VRSEKKKNPPVHGMRNLAADDDGRSGSRASTGFGLLTASLTKTGPSTGAASTGAAMEASRAAAGAGRARTLGRRVRTLIATA